MYVIIIAVLSYVSTAGGLCSGVVLTTGVTIGSGVCDTGGVGPLEDGPLIGEESLTIPPNTGFFDLFIRSSNKLISLSANYNNDKINTQQINNIL